MSVKHMLKTRVEVFRDNKRVLQTKANVQEGKIYFGDVDIKVLDTVKVPGLKTSYKIFNIYPQLKGNKVLYKKATVEIIEL